MDPLAWAGILLAIALVTGTLELFIPSGGILGLLTLIALMAAVGLAFRHSAGAGLGVLSIVVLGVPVIVAVALHYWPNTPMGRRLLLKTPVEGEVMPDNPTRRKLKSLVGKVGEAKTLMTPNGAVVIEDRIIDAVSEGLVIEPGQRVRVVEVRGARVVVQPTLDEPSSAAAAKDPLSQPIESLGLDPFEDPLA